jgi:AcrR family transcriptional regulator
MAGMTAPGGRREANKEATRAALRAVARELFASRGYEQTTVRDIAQAANVTERTFYRYFDGKEGLVADGYLSWLTTLENAIKERPPEEPPLTAVHRALLAVIRQAATAATRPIWAFSANPAEPRPWRANARPLLRLEEAVAAGIRARQSCRPAGGTAPAAWPADDFEIQVLARVCVAAIRSAIIEFRARRREDESHGARASSGGSHGAPGDLVKLIDRAFTIVNAVQAKAGSQPDR